MCEYANIKSLGMNVVAIERKLGVYRSPMLLIMAYILVTLITYEHHHIVNVV